MRSAINNSQILTSIISNQCASINGLNSICLNANQVYSLSDANGLSAIWSVTGNLQLVSQNATIAVIRGTSNLQGTGTLVASLSNGQKITKTILIGAPTLIGINYNYINSFGWYYAGLNFNYDVDVNPSINATHYRWTLELDADDFQFTCSTAFAKFFNNGSTVSIFGVAEFISTSPTAKINWGKCSANYILTCYAVNDCGETQYFSKHISVNKSNPCLLSTTSFSRLSINQNPIKSGAVIVVNIREDQVPCNPTISSYKTANVKNEYCEVKIFDMSGRLLYSNNIQQVDDAVQIENTKLNSGNYILNITLPNGQTESKIIIIQ